MESVDIRIADLDDPAWDRPSLCKFLSSEERSRADSFVFEAHRRRYETGRAIVRLLLSKCLGEAPGDVVITTDANGKPGLSQRGFYFNVSHSGPILAVALCGHPVGVDVERVRPVEQFDDIARRVFTEEEREYLSTLTDEQRLRGFYDLWTLKEAVLKGIGVGLLLSPLALQVRIGGPPRLAVPLPPGCEPADWSLAGFDVPSMGWASTEACGAVAVAGDGVEHVRLNVESHSPR